MDAADVCVVSSRVDPDKGSYTAVAIGRVRSRWASPPTSG